MEWLKYGKSNIPIGRDLANALISLAFTKFPRDFFSLQQMNKSGFEVFHEFASTKNGGLEKMLVIFIFEYPFFWFSCVALHFPILMA